MVSLLLSLGSGLPGGREVGIMANPSSAHPISSLLRLAASVLSLGFGFGPILSLGRQGWPNGKPCLEGLEPPPEVAGWSRKFALVWVPFFAGGLRPVARRIVRILVLILGPGGRRKAKKNKVNELTSSSI